MAQAVATEWILTDFDPRMPGFAENPYPFYARLREEDPVHFLPQLNMWWATRHADCVFILQDSRFGQTPAHPVPTPPLPPEILNLPPSMFVLDPPDHTRVRSLFNKAFTPRMIERLQGHVESVAGHLLDRVAAQGHMDVMADFAMPMPVTVIAEMLGVPASDWNQFRIWTTTFALAADATQPQSVRERALQAQLAMIAYLHDLVAERTRKPQNDLISDLIAVEEHGQRLQSGEIVSNCFLLLVTGHESTANLIGSGLLTLLRNPDQLALLRSFPELYPTAIEELLRYECPVQRTGRWVKQDVELGGKLLKKGEKVVAVMGAGNRDPEVFADPERLDITRNPNPHLGLGRGAHYCIGSSLARLEAKVAFASLLNRFPGLKLNVETPEWNPNTFIRGLRSLPVTF